MVILPGLKPREADHLNPSNAEVKNGWGVAATTPYALAAYVSQLYLPAFTFLRLPLAQLRGRC
jgi:hypothetical protein